MAKKEKKFQVKLNALFMQSQARDVVTGILFNQNDWAEIGESDWKRLKEKTWTLDGKSYPLLIQADSESPVEDNEAEDAPWEADVEEIAKNGSVLQDTEVEEE